MTYSDKFVLDKYYKSNLDKILTKAIPNKWDALGVFHGREGSGKTTLAIQTCKYLDPKFTVHNIVFSPQQFEQAIEHAQPESAILWDEAITGAKSTQYADKISQTIIENLTIIREKGLKIMLCFPYLYMLNKYYVSRCIFSCHVFAKGFTKRGYVYFYGSTKTEILYNLMKERYKYNYLEAVRKAKRNFYFRFSKAFPVDEQSYLEKKRESRSNGYVDDKWKERFKKAMVYIRDETNGNIKEYCKIAEINTNSVYNML